MPGSKKMKKATAILVHGIGNFGEQKTRDAIGKNLKVIGYSNLSMRFVNWNKLVGQPVHQEGISTEWVATTLNSIRYLAAGSLKKEFDSSINDNVILLSVVILCSVLIGAIFVSLPLLTLTSLMMLLPQSAVDEVQLFILKIIGASLLLVSFGTFVLNIAYRAGLTNIVVRKLALCVFWNILSIPSFLYFYRTRILIGFGILIFMTYGEREAELTERMSFSLANPWLLGLTIYPSVIIISGVVRWGAHSTLSHILKMTGDTFRYLADEKYRNLIITEYQNILARTNQSTILIISHSLGTLISVDFLLNHNSNQNPSRRILLVTMGSPLRRFIHRFFPNQCPSPLDINRRLKTKYNDFIWINIFRAKDPVGTKLFDGNVQYSYSDIDTNQNDKGVLKSHVDYWSDPKIATNLPKWLSRKKSKKISKKKHRRRNFFYQK